MLTNIEIQQITADENNLDTKPPVEPGETPVTADENNSDTKSHVELGNPSVTSTMSNYILERFIFGKPPYDKQGPIESALDTISSTIKGMMPGQK